MAGERRGDGRVVSGIEASKSPSNTKKATYGRQSVAVKENDGSDSGRFSHPCVVLLSYKYC